jgi:hypothetical protein
LLLVERLVELDPKAGAPSALLGYYLMAGESPASFR